MNHNQLYEAALGAANALPADTSVSLETVLASLKSLRDEIVILMDGVETEIGQRPERISPSHQQADLI